jgi:aminoglycoside phosphotransferase (APT) family kinase protein
VTNGQELDAFRQLVARIDPRATLVRAWNLTGGVSARVTALEIEASNGHTTKLIVRLHGEVDRAHNPHVARDEFKLLQIAQDRGLAAPRPRYLDESCELLPTPYLVVDYVEGETIFAPADLSDYLAQMTAQLAKIHGVNDAPELSFLPQKDRWWGERPETLDASLNEGRIRDALESIWPVEQVNESVLLHGDYWPGNILWKDGQLEAVIDWEDARVGDPLDDVACARLELLWAHGVEAMNEFTERYRSMTSIDFTNLPYWDLCEALRPCGKLSGWGLEAETEQRYRELNGWIVDQAIDRLSAG